MTEVKKLVVTVLGAFESSNFTCVNRIQFEFILAILGKVASQFVVLSGR